MRNRRGELRGHSLTTLSVGTRAIPCASGEPIWRADPPGKVFEQESSTVTCSDALSFLLALQPNSADIVFLDPPFNLGKSYGSKGPDDDRLSESAYFQQQSSILEQASRVLKDGGALYLYHLPSWAFRFAEVLRAQLQFRHWIAISMKNGFARGKFLYPAHYALLYFTKGDPAHFQRPKVPMARCRHCGGPIKDYGGYAKYVESGLNISDVWDDVSPVRHSKYKTRSANELSPLIPRRVVEISGFSGGVLVDPFAGSGSAVLEARKVGMSIAACDREISQVRLILKRLKQLS